MLWKQLIKCNFVAILHSDRCKLPTRFVSSFIMISLSSPDDCLFFQSRVKNPMFCRCYVQQPNRNCFAIAWNALPLKNRMQKSFAFVFVLTFRFLSLSCIASWRSKMHQQTYLIIEVFLLLFSSSPLSSSLLFFSCFRNCAAFSTFLGTHRNIVDQAKRFNEKETLSFRFV